MNKKFILGTALILPLVLSGCSNKKKDTNKVTFQQFNFEAEVTGFERDRIMFEVLEAAKQIKSVKSERTDYVYNDYDNCMNAEGTVETTLYNGYFLNEISNVETRTKRDHIITTEKATTDEYEWVDGEKMITVDYRKATRYYNNVEEIQDEDALKARREGLNNRFLADVGDVFDEGKLFKEGKFYYAINEKYEEEHAFEPYGDNEHHKERINIDRKQEVLKIDEAYKIVSWTLFKDEQSNVPSYEHYIDKPVVVEETTEKKTVTYGDKEDGAAKFSAIVSEFYGKQLSDDTTGMDVETGYYDKDTKTFTQQGQMSRDIIGREDSSLVKRHYDIRVYGGSNDQNALKITNSLNYRPNGYQGTVDIARGTLPLKDALEPFGFTEVKIGEGTEAYVVYTYDAMPAGGSFLVSYDVTLTNENTLSFENVTVVPYFSNMM